jgi:GNAT superfamily N-acetyltransferase
MITAATSRRSVLGSRRPVARAEFYRPTARAPAVESPLQIREVGAVGRDSLADTAVAGFGMPPMLAAWLGQIVGRPRWHAYAACADAAPLAAGALYLGGDFAWLGIAATLPGSRRQGVQTALLAHRLSEAARLGARHATTETGVPQPGGAAPSYRNILRAGFEVAYLRPNWTQPQWL